jgi:cytochrome c biogenesis protein CcmG, thiol:disulfide interchange protein DsbE
MSGEGATTRAASRVRFGLPATLVILGLLVLLAYGVSRSTHSDTIESALAAGKRPTAPALSLPLLGGGHRSLASFRGSVVVLNFWASWCPPCQGEAPVLERWQPVLAKYGGTMVGVDVLDVTSDALAFARRHHLTYPMLRDESGAHERPFGVFGYPETLVIDRHGRIASVQRGPVDDLFFTTTVLPVLRSRA